jgi:hypothetical protein
MLFASYVNMILFFMIIMHLILNPIVNLLILNEKIMQIILMILIDYLFIG